MELIQTQVLWGVKNLLFSLHLTVFNSFALPQMLSIHSEDIDKQPPLLHL